ncbi:hypothetical protein BLNAU_6741 [Blattamonas nauphoetae]|uniref:Uncharacterized protein n=1 Tax=Blattamonas nauphoetae TaxID=2049346 RepID=A0ABQ9Y3K5_9EUKA|nr:hypothetical protein BLNAU_6741 [Blattamonas nauphoetae]
MEMPHIQIQNKILIHFLRALHPHLLLANQVFRLQPKLRNRKSQHHLLLGTKRLPQHNPQYLEHHDLDHLQMS